MDLYIKGSEIDGWIRQNYPNLSFATKFISPEQVFHSTITLPSKVSGTPQNSGSVSSGTTGILTVKNLMIVSAFAVGGFLLWRYER
jgi:hypothetical protein